MKVKITDVVCNVLFDPDVVARIVGPGDQGTFPELEPDPMRGDRADLPVSRYRFGAYSR